VELISWNVNGLRAVLKKDFPAYLETRNPDIFCLQETKCWPDDVDQLWHSGYSAHWNWAEKKGYSGTLILSKQKPLKVSTGMGRSEHDKEGRIVTTEFPAYHLVNVYVPNSQDGLRRLDYRQEWDRDFLAYLKGLEQTKPVVVCGDFNVAHKEIDLARPKANVTSAGFTPEERRGFDGFVEAGLIDTFREFETGPDHYSWWSFRGGARARNVGWRIDYFLISAALRPSLKHAFIEPQVTGSDHCPVGITLE
jgi:exodeoxyribonuclease III